jgi:PAS domain S-box-containing protein
MMPSNHEPRKQPADRTPLPESLSPDELWQALVESAFDLVFTLDPEGFVLSVNRTAPGFTIEEMVGATAPELVVPEHRGRAQEAIRRVFERAETVDLEIQDARVRRWYACRVTPVMRGDTPVAALVIASDVTARKASEQALRAERDKARQYLAVAGVILVTLDTHGRVTLVNQMGCDVLGFRADEIIGKNWFDHFVPERMREMVRTEFQGLMEGKRTELPEMYENPVVTWSGKERLIAWRNTVLRGDEGQIVATLSSGEDITERRRAEQALRQAHDELERRVVERTQELARINELLREDIVKRKRVERELRESEEQFRAIANATPIPIMISRSRDGLIMYGNQQLSEVSGRPVAELIGMKTPDFYEDPAEREAVVAEIRRVGFIRNREVQVRLSDGSSAWVLLSAVPIKHHGEPAMLSGLLDITKRKAYEEQLQSERRLLRRLLDLNERDRQLIAYEIHDGIVQEMTASLMFLEAACHAMPLENQAASENREQGIRLLRESIQEARRLIDGLRPAVLDEAGVVAAVENLAAEMPQKANLFVTVNHDVQFVRIAPTLEMAIYRIVQEGLNNAWQHSGADTASVALIQQGDRLRITVRDEGSGFDPQKVQKKRYGLAGVRERARLLGGAVRIESAPGAGATIRVELPLTDVLLPQVEPLPDEEEGGRNDE